MWSHVLAGLLTVAFVFPEPAWSASRDSRTELEIYIDVVNHHQAGIFNTSEDELQKLTGSELGALRRAMTELAAAFEQRQALHAETPQRSERIVLARRSYGLAALAARLRLRPDRPNDAAPFFKRAALFHADAIVVYMRELAPTWVARHELLGRAATDLLAAVWQEHARVVDWWIVVIGFLTMPMPHAAGLAADDALARMSGEARLELAAGAAYEALASPRTQDAVAAYDEARKVQERIAPMDSPATNLRRAADILERATEHEPHLAEAHLRLGRVRVLLGDLPRARAALEEARQAANDDGFVTYHAAMFLGNLEERAGRRAVAESEYRAALRIAPAAQAPRLALSQLRHEAGQAREALDLLVPYLSAGRRLGDAQEPWLSYGLGAGREANDIFAHLLQEWQP